MRARIVSLALLAGCAATSAEKPASAAATPRVEPAAAGPVEPAQPAPTAVDKTLRRELSNDGSPYLGALDRAGLVAVIDQGLGRLLARIKLSPALRAGRYQGFRVTETDPAWVGTGLVVGDVLMRVNGQTIERPEQAQAAFESLRVASEVALEIARDGRKLSLRYRVE